MLGTVRPTRHSVRKGGGWLEPRGQIRRLKALSPDRHANPVHLLPASGRDKRARTKRPGGWQSRLPRAVVGVVGRRGVRSRPIGSRPRCHGRAARPTRTRAGRARCDKARGASGAAAPSVPPTSEPRSGIVPETSSALQRDSVLRSRDVRARRGRAARRRGENRPPPWATHRRLPPRAGGRGQTCCATPSP